MKKLLTSTAMLLALGASVAITPVQAQERQEREVWNEQERGLWESDNWGNDEFGSYDQDFVWETEDKGWEGWVGNDAEAWRSYDDIGDEGWMDV